MKTRMILKGVEFYFLCLAIAICSVTLAQPQTANPTGSTSSVVPNLVKFTGTISNADAKLLSGVVGLTFALYKDQQGGVPLWLETQNVSIDKSGHYNVSLGASKTEGLPTDLFISGEPRWLGVQPQGQEEQPRVVLMSVPYALKALDAETIGGRPASSFMLAPAASSNSDKSDAPPPANITGSGTANFVPLFTGTSTIGNSKMFQTVGGNVGINTTTPAARLDVKGTGDVRDTLTLFPKGAHPTLSVQGTAFGVSNTGVVSFVSGQAFPGTGTVTSVGSGAGLTGGPITTNGTLSIVNGGVTNTMLQNSSMTVTANSPLSGGGAVSLGGSTSLGLKSCSSNQVLEFISGSWICANAGNGTITGVTAGTDLTGGGTNGNVTLNLNTAATDSRYAQLAAANTFAQPQTINGVSSGLTANASDPAGVALTGSGFIGVEAISTTSGGVGVDAFGTIGVAGSGSTGAGVAGGSSTGNGVQGASSSNNGVYGVAGKSTGLGGVAGVWGDAASHVGVYGTSTSSYGVQGVSSAADGVNGTTNASNVSGVAGINNAGGTGVYGLSSGGFGFKTPNNVSQDRGAGGWVKAMIFVDPFTQNGTAITRCYNSQASGAAVSTPPCGFSINHERLGEDLIDFGFQVNDRFVSGAPFYAVTMQTCVDDPNNSCLVDGFFPLTANQLDTFTVTNAGNATDVAFWVIVF